MIASGSKTVSAEAAREIYYRVNGKPFNSLRRRRVRLGPEIMPYRPVPRGLNDSIFRFFEVPIAKP